MGRPKKGAKKAEPLKPKTVGIRATGEWAAWVDRFAKYRRTDIAKLIDAALAEHAESTGFNEKPPVRVP